MIGRLAHVASSWALAAGLTLALAVSCYAVPQPVCGFVCGPAGACPADYACSSLDNRCHLNGSPADLVCPSIDAGIDAPDLVPFVTNMFPGDNELDVPLNVTLTATFSEDVTGVSASTFTLARQSDAEPVASNVSYNIATRTASLDPSPLLEPSTIYVARLSPQIEDLTGNPLLSPLSWVFMTGDTVPPTVIARTPADGATGVAVDATISATFSEDVTPPGPSGFSLEAGGAAIPGVVAYESPSQTATYLPGLQLAPFTLHTATLTANIFDLSGNPLANAPVTWMFTTGADTVAPRVVTTLPLDAATGVSVDATIRVRFDEPVVGVTASTFTVDGGAIAGTIALSMADTVATFTPTTALPANATITVALTTEITDGSTNPLAAPLTFSFVTAP